MKINKIKNLQRAIIFANILMGASLIILILSIIDMFSGSSEINIVLIISCSAIFISMLIYSIHQNKFLRRMEKENIQ